jgi:two-component system OmpR family sensor kinase
MRSIRRQLLLWLLALLLATGAVAAAGLYFRIRDEANELFDYHLRQMALSLRDQALAQGAPSVSDELQYDFVIQVWSPTGERIYLSHPHSALPNRARLGFENVITAEGAWRVFSVQLRDRTIQVAQPLAARAQLAETLALRTLLPFAALIPLLGLLVWIIVGRGLRPLSRLADDVAARSASALSALPEAGLPAEVTPLVRALNDLLARLARSIEMQRNFVSDAAHELRTPLAAVQLQAQIVDRARSDAERAVALAQLKNGMARAAHVVQQLLTLARQEPDAPQPAFEPVDLNRLAKQVIVEQQPIAAAKRIDLGISRDDPLVVMGDGDALHTLLSNLVDNAIRYIPAGGKIDVALADEEGMPTLSVIDNGPGIPEQERERVFDRFYRSAGHEAGGSGLGLAIVNNVVARHRARIALSDAAGGIGLCVAVRFPKGDLSKRTDAR